MAAYVSAMHGSPHRNVDCMDCHEASLATKLRHIRVHLVGDWPETIRLRDVDVLAMVPNCQKCHQQEYATWHAGPHSATYSQIFTNPAHNSKRRLMDDCLRCHGMHFDGSVRDLVQPMNTQGPLASGSQGTCRSAGDALPGLPLDASRRRAGNQARRSASRWRARLCTIRWPSTTAAESMHFAAAELSIPAALRRRPRR